MRLRAGLSCAKRAVNGKITSCFGLGVFFVKRKEEVLGWVATVLDQTVRELADHHWW
jgi:hypothetical protein